MSSSKKAEESNTKTAALVPIDKKQVKDLKTRAKALIDTFNGLGNALKKATNAHEEFINLLPPHLDGITQALQSIQEAQAKKRRRAEKDPDAPKKPPTSYFLFSSAIRPKVKEDHPDLDQQALATLMGAKWKALSPEEKRVWEEKAQLAKEKFAEEDKAYKASKANVGKKGSSAESSDEEAEEEEEEEKPAPKKQKKEAPAPSKSTEVDKKAEAKKKEEKKASDKKKEQKGKDKTPAKKDTKKDDKKKSKK